MRHAPATTGLLAGLLVSVPALAGTIIEIDGADEGIGRMVISEGHMRMESGGDVTLFDAAANEVTIIEPDDRSYYVVTRQDVERIAQQMAQVREQMEQQLQNVPEEQRAGMRKQMESMMPGAGARPDIRLEATGGSGQVAGTSCREARLYHGDQATHEVCVAEPDALGIPRGDFDTMMSMFTFFDEIAGAMGGGGGDIGARAMQRMMDELDGMPARARPLQEGPAWEISRVETRPVDADRFEVPPGYSESEGIGGQMP